MNKFIVHKIEANALKHVLGMHCCIICLKEVMYEDNYFFVEKRSPNIYNARTQDSTIFLDSARCCSLLCADTWILQNI